MDCVTSNEIKISKIYKTITHIFPFSITIISSHISDIFNFIKIKGLLFEVKPYIFQNSYVLITLDGHFQFWYHHLKHSKIKKVIVVSLKDFLPEYNHYLFDDSILMKSDNTKYLIKEKINEGIKECKNCNNLELLYLKDIFNIDKNSNITIKSESIDLEKDISYFYISGSREEPKCIVFKNKSYSAFLEINWNYFPLIEENKFDSREIHEGIKVLIFFKK